MLGAGASVFCHRTAPAARRSRSHVARTGGDPVLRFPFSTDAKARLQVALVWDGQEFIIEITNKRSVSISDISVSIRQLLSLFGDDAKNITVVRSATGYLPPLTRARFALDIEGEPSSIGISYKVEEVPVGYNYDLPKSFVDAWINRPKHRRVWRLPSWSVVRSVRNEINKHGLTRHVLEMFGDSTILILGMDTGSGLRRLQEIKTVIEHLGYYALLSKDISDQNFHYQTNEEKVLYLASTCLFTIIEDSEPAGQIDELSILARSRKTIAVLRLEGRGSTWMTSDYEIDFRNVRGFTYSSGALHRCVVDAVDWAEETVEARRHALRRLYPWR